MPDLPAINPDNPLLGLINSGETPDLSSAVKNIKSDNPLLGLIDPERHKREYQIPNYLKNMMASEVTWDQVAPRIKEIFNVDPEQYRQQYQLDEARAVQKGEGIGTMERFLESSIPFGSAIRNWRSERKLGEAVKRYQEGKATGEDAFTIARHERKLEVEHNLSTPAAAMAELARIPALVGEFAVGGGIASKAGKLIPGLAGRTIQGTGVVSRAAQGAAATPFVPSGYLQHGAQNQNANPNQSLFQSYAPAVALSAAQNAVLGQLQGIGGIVPTRIGRIAAKTGIGLGEAAGVDIAATGLDRVSKSVVGSSLGLDTKWGTLGAVLREASGKKEPGEDATKQAVVQLLTFGVFSAMHSGHPSARLNEAFKKAVEEHTAEEVKEVGDKVLESVQKGETPEFKGDTKLDNLGRTYSEAVKDKVKVGPYEIDATDLRDFADHWKINADGPIESVLKRVQGHDKANSALLRRLGREKLGLGAQPETPLPPMGDNLETPPAPPAPTTPPKVDPNQFRRNPAAELAHQLGLGDKIDQGMTDNFGAQMGGTVFLESGDHSITLHMPSPGRVRVGFTANFADQSSERQAVPGQMHGSSLKLFKDFKNVAAKLKESGMSVEYAAHVETPEEGNKKEGYSRRDDAYAKVLKDLGFTLESRRVEGNEVVSSWSPAERKTSSDIEASSVMKPGELAKYTPAKKISDMSQGERLGGLMGLFNAMIKKIKDDKRKLPRVTEEQVIAQKMEPAHYHAVLAEEHRNLRIEIANELKTIASQVAMLKNDQANVVGGYLPTMKRKDGREMTVENLQEDIDALLEKRDKLSKIKDASADLSIKHEDTADDIHKVVKSQHPDKVVIDPMMSPEAHAAANGAGTSKAKKEIAEILQGKKPFWPKDVKEPPKPPEEAKIDKLMARNIPGMKSRAAAKAQSLRSAFEAQNAPPPTSKNPLRRKPEPPQSAKTPGNLLLNRMRQSQTAKAPPVVIPKGKGAYIPNIGRTLAPLEPPPIARTPVISEPKKVKDFFGKPKVAEGKTPVEAAISESLGLATKEGQKYKSALRAYLFGGSSRKSKELTGTSHQTVLTNARKGLDVLRKESPEVFGKYEEGQKGLESLLADVNAESQSRATEAKESAGNELGGTQRYTRGRLGAMIVKGLTKKDLQGLSSDEAQAAAAHAVKLGKGMKEIGRDAAQLRTQIDKIMRPFEKSPKKWEELNGLERAKITEELERLGRQLERAELILAGLRERDVLQPEEKPQTAEAAPAKTPKSKKAKPPAEPAAGAPAEAKEAEAPLSKIEAALDEMKGKTPAQLKRMAKKKAIEKFKDFMSGDSGHFWFPTTEFFKNMAQNVYRRTYGSKRLRKGNFIPHMTADGIPAPIPKWKVVRKVAYDQIGAFSRKLHEIPMLAHAWLVDTGRQMANAWKIEMALKEDPFKDRPHWMDDIEREMDNPGSQGMNKAELEAVELWKKIREAKTRELYENGGKIYDDKGRPLTLEAVLKQGYFHRLAVKPASLVQNFKNLFGIGGSKPGFRQSFRKSRRNTLQEGSDTEYHGFYDAIHDFIAGVNKEISESHIAKDKLMQGEDLLPGIRKMLFAKNKTVLNALKSNPAERKKLINHLLAEAHQRATGNVTVAPAFKRYKYPQEVASDLRAQFGERGGPILKAVASANDTFRTLVLGGDASFAFLQMLPMAMSNPVRWARTVAQIPRAFLDGNMLPKLAQKYPEIMRAIKIMSQAGGTFGTPMDRTLAPGDNPLRHLGKIGRGVAKMYDAASRAMTQTLDLAKVELFLANEPKDPKDYPALVEAIEYTLGQGRMEKIGMPPERALLERMAFTAPSYYRSLAGLTKMAFRRGPEGFMARKQLAFLAGGIALYSIAGIYALKAAGEISDEEAEERLNPSRGKFLTIPLPLPGGKSLEIGFGSLMMSVMRTIGNTERYAKGQTGDNPLVRWYRGHAGVLVRNVWDLGSGTDYLGKPTSTGEVAAKTFAPLSLQQGFEGEGNVPQRAGNIVASTLGLRSYPKSDTEDYKDQLRKLSEAKYGKRYEDIPYMQQADLVRSLGEHKPPSTEGARLRALEADQLRANRLTKAADKETMTKLKEFGHTQLPAYDPVLSIGGISVPLTRQRAEKYEELLVEEYDKTVKEWPMDKLRDASDPQREAYIKRSLEQAKARARLRLLSER